MDYKYYPVGQLVGTTNRETSVKQVISGYSEKCLAQDKGRLRTVRDNHARGRSMIGAHPKDNAADVLVVGTGAAGLTAAVTAAKAGLSVVLIEKEPVFGGTSATSGGSLWIPCSRHSHVLGRKLGVNDSIEAARSYLEKQSGPYVDHAKIDAYLSAGPRMVKFLEKDTEVEFEPREFPDYHSDEIGASRIRTIRAMDYEAASMGGLMKTLKGELPQTLFLGLALRSAAEIRTFMSAGRSLRSLRYVLKRMSRHFFDLAVYGASRNITGGRALVARLARTANDLGVPMLLSSPVTTLICDGTGRVTGLRAETPHGTRELQARKAVVLATGGYPYDLDRRRAHHPGAAGRNPPVVPLPIGNTGDGARLAEAVGGCFNGDLAQAAAWMPTSQLPGRTDQSGVWPHLVDRYKPGFIMVLADGQRFANEAASYHDLGAAMLRAFDHRGTDRAWLICDACAFRRWGMGFAKPFPIPNGGLLRSGYLLKRGSLGELAVEAEIDGKALQATVDRFNQHARRGEDPDYGRGSTPYDLHQGDEGHLPNPSLGPLETPPYYAVRIHVGEIGSFKGLATDVHSRVLDSTGDTIPGLYAVGNDQANAFGGAYPGAGGTLGPGMVFAWLAAHDIVNRARVPQPTTDQGFVT